MDILYSLQGKAMPCDVSLVGSIQGKGSTGIGAPTLFSLRRSLELGGLR